MKSIRISQGLSISNKSKIVIIAGPCQMEGRDHVLMMAEKLVDITSRLGIGFVFKTSFDKANRTSLSGQRGVGLQKSLPIFRELKETFGFPILTDIHKESDCEDIKDYVDILQIPAFLCRQTDLLEAAAKTGKIINVKKGQFLAPQDMQNVAEKLNYFGCQNVILTERGASFGYNNLVVDMRSLAIMAQTGYPIVIDATHATQSPGGLGTASGGNREYAPIIARAAVAVGVAGVFMEVHNDPDNAPSDGPCMIRLNEFEEILKRLKDIDNVVKSYV